MDANFKAELLGEIIAANVVAKFACKSPQCCAERAQAIINKLETLMERANEYRQSQRPANKAL